MAVIVVKCATEAIKTYREQFYRAGGYSVKTISNDYAIKMAPQSVDGSENEADIFGDQCPYIVVAVKQT